MEALRPHAPALRAASSPAVPTAPPPSTHSRCCSFAAHHAPLLSLLCSALHSWYVPSSAGPASADGPSTQLWIYRSNANPTPDTQSGLAGPLVVGRPGSLGANGKPSDVDRELFLMLQVRPAAAARCGTLALWLAWLLLFACMHACALHAIARARTPLQRLA